MFKRIGALAKVLRNPEILTKVMSGGGADYASPSAWQLSTYGPSMPIQPITRPRDVEIPRAIDYPIAINSMLTPRTGYSNGGIPLRPFGDMATAYESVSECRAPVSLIQRELSAFRPRLVDKNGNEVMGHPYQWMCELPDGETPFSVWLSRFVKSTKVYDAPALYFDRDNSGKIKGLHYIDGSTLFAIVNEFGKTPKPTLIQEYLLNVSQNGVAQPSLTVPDAVLGPSSVAEFINQYNNRLRDGNDVPLKVPAYTQVIKGSPYAWWSSDDIWYQPQSMRTNAPYGESFIEACWTWIMIVANIQSFELAHYRTGNMPEGYFTVSKEFFATTDEVMNAEDVFNARMTSNPLTERNRVRVFPDGTKFEATKKADFPEKLYTQANKNIWHSIGIPPAEFGDTPGGGLGGAGFKKGSSDELSRNTLNPHRIFVGIPFNEVLRRDGITDVTFVLDYPVVQIDVDKLNQSVYDGMTHGTLSLNDGLGRLGLSPVGDPNDKENIANKHLILGGGVVFVIEDMDVQNGIAMPSFGGKDKTGGEPVGPETVAKMNGLEHTSEDIQTLMRVIKNVQEHGTLDSKTYSIPFSKANFDPNQPRNEKGEWDAEGAEGAGGKVIEDKPFEELFRTSKNLDEASSRANSLLKSKTGLRDFALGLGAHPGDTIALNTMRPGVVQMTISNDSFKMTRTLYSDSNGSLVITNDEFRIEKDKQAQGLGTKLFAQEVAWAQTKGVSRIDTEADRKYDANGYYTWPRLGYDGTMDQHIAEAATESGLVHASKVSDLMKTSEGRDWWKKHGNKINVSFDLSPNSQSLKVFNAYKAAKGIK